MRIPTNLILHLKSAEKIVIASHVSPEGDGKSQRPILRFV